MKPDKFPLRMLARIVYVGLSVSASVSASASVSVSSVVIGPLAQLVRAYG